ncbi:MAG: hypothetical protein WD336_10130 [Trueperaceae bacterium]
MTIAFAGDFLTISLGQLYAVGLMTAAPGLVCSLPVLHAAARGRAVPLATLLLLWLAIGPWLALAAVSAVTPGVLAMRHRYDEVEYLLRILLPGTVALPAAATAL